METQRFDTESQTGPRVEPPAGGTTGGRRTKREAASSRPKPARSRTSIFAAPAEQRVPVCWRTSGPGYLLPVATFAIRAQAVGQRSSTPTYAERDAATANVRLDDYQLEALVEASVSQ